ncbi:phytochrome-interacting factor 3.1 [Populus alba x Populus x berolinensis]|nr:phytochrome-interacting factor 3.1 [Populus alba x Populus x berolinensis]
MQKQVPEPSPINSSLMNFSHFARPAALVKANLQNVGMRASSGTSRMERTQNKDKGSIGLPKETGSHCRPNMMSSKVEVKPTEVKPAEGSVPAELPEEMSQEGDSKSDRNCHQNFGESAIKGLADVEKTTEPLVASSSVGSGNSTERPSDDPTENLKRKTSRVSRCKKIQLLLEQVDKASMLDEAIEYLKTLQLQVQVNSAHSSQNYVNGSWNVHAINDVTSWNASHACSSYGQFLPMGVGMGMGFRMGMPDMNGGYSGCPMYHVPPMHGAHFPGSPMSGPSALHGMGGPGLQMFGLSGQGLPMSFPRAPLMPMPGGPPPKTNREPNDCGVVGPMDNLDSATASSSKDAIQNTNSQVMQNNVANRSMNQTSSQCQATNECFEQPAFVQNNGEGSEVAESGVLKSAGGTDIIPSRATEVNHLCFISTLNLLLYAVKLWDTGSTYECVKRFHGLMKSSSYNNYWSSNFREVELQLHRFWNVEETQERSYLHLDWCFDVSFSETRLTTHKMCRVSLALE